jgi:hypothetical protein
MDKRKLLIILFILVLTLTFFFKLKNPLTPDALQMFFTNSLLFTAMQNTPLIIL